MQNKWSFVAAALLLSIVFAFAAILPPRAQGPDTAAEKFSSARAMPDIRIIAAAPHPTGSSENAKVRSYLRKRLEELGAQVSESQSTLDERSLARLNRWSGEDKSEQNIVNIIGVLPGKDRSKPAVLLMAHHDTVWESPGAADDTIGIASIFEITRALTARGEQERDLVVLFTDGEELGLVGARDFFNSHPLKDKVGAVVNFEARGGGGTANMFQTSARNGAAVRLYAGAVSQPSASSLSTFVYSVLPNDTDLTPALKGDYTAYNIANIGRAGLYHSPLIDANALDERSLQHMGMQGLDLTQALLSAETIPSKTRDEAFFDVFGVFTVIFPAFWGWIFLLGAGGCYVWAQQDRPRVREIMAGSARMVGFLLIGGGVLYGVNWLSGAGSSANYYDRLAAIPRLEWAALFACLAVFFLLFGREVKSKTETLAASLPLFVFGVAGQAYAPTAAYFITLPLLLCGGAALLMSRWSHKRPSLVLAAVLCALVMGYMLGLGHLLMLGVGPDMLSAVCLPAAIFALALLPLYPGVSRRTQRILSVGAIVVAIGLAIWIRLDPLAETVATYSIK